MIGELICELRNGKPYIVRADPVIQVTFDVIHWWRLGADGPDALFVSCNTVGEETLFTLKGSNREYIYRLGAYDPATGLWTLAWPD